jgi:hypothetical protein
MTLVNSYRDLCPSNSVISSFMVIPRGWDAVSLSNYHLNPQDNAKKFILSIFVYFSSSCHAESRDLTWTIPSLSGSRPGLAAPQLANLKRCVTVSFEDIITCLTPVRVLRLAFGIGIDLLKAFLAINMKKKGLRLWRWWTLTEIFVRQTLSFRHLCSSLEGSGWLGDAVSITIWIHTTTQRIYFGYFRVLIF